MGIFPFHVHIDYSNRFRYFVVHIRLCDLLNGMSKTGDNWYNRYLYFRAVLCCVAVFAIADKIHKTDRNC